MIAAVGARRLGTVSRCFYFQSQVMNLNFKPGWSQHNPPICLRRNLSFQSFADFNHSIATSSPVQFLMTNFISFHEWLHLPWFVEIALVTFMVRACIAFPLTIHQRKIIHRYESLKPEIMQISKSLKTKTMEQAYVAGISKRKSNILYQKALSAEIKRLVERDNCHPVKAGMVPFFQIPAWITLSHSYRNIARIYPDPNDVSVINANNQLREEGFLWFTDLTVPDTLGLLPFMTAIVNLTIIQLIDNERKRNKQESSLFAKIVLNGGRAFSLAIIPIGLVMPSCMSYYWLLSSTFGLIQNMILLNPKFKQAIGIDEIKVNKNIIKNDALLKDKAKK